MRRIWVTICEIEPGLFQAIYSNSGVQEEKFLPAYHAGACIGDAKLWFEQSALAAGFKEVVWIDVLAADLLRPHHGRLGISHKAALVPLDREPILP
jgi:hypothetical protein